jgi:hypothetical protein
MMMLFFSICGKTQMTKPTVLVGLGFFFLLFTSHKPSPKIKNPQKMGVINVCFYCNLKNITHQN